MDKDIERWYSMKEIIEYLGVSHSMILDRIEHCNMSGAKIGKL